MKFKLFVALAILAGLCTVGSANAGASDICGSAGEAAQSAQDAFTRADSALLSGDKPNALSAYAAGMTALTSAPWIATDKKCDQQHFSLFRLTAALHSLVTAVHLQQRDPLEAWTLRQNMWKDLLQFGNPQHPFVYDGLISTYQKNDAALWSQLMGYSRELYVSEETTKAALHAPTGPGCRRPSVSANIDHVAYLSDVRTARDANVRDGTYVLRVTVQLDADGKVLSAALLSGTGNADYDAGIVEEAKQSTYLPAVANCKRVPSSYVFESTMTKETKH